VIKVIQLARALAYNRDGRNRLIANEFDAWLDQMATEPLPGGVAAAALAAVMGAALVAKVAGIGQSELASDSAGRGTLPSAAALAQASRVELLGLAATDEVAYRRVLDTRHLPAEDKARQQAWQRATTLPLLLAEACRHLLAEVDRLEDVGSPGVAVDLEIGRLLLEAGAEAGVLAVRENLRAWGAHSDSVPYRQRLAALMGQEEEV
jgi:formiminotetrahydrofolate cyclodeaminase